MYFGSRIAKKKKNVGSRIAKCVTFPQKQGKHQLIKCIFDPLRSTVEMFWFSTCSHSPCIY